MKNAIKNILFNIIALSFSVCFSVLFVDKLIAIAFPGNLALWTNPSVIIAMSLIAITGYCFAKDELNEISGQNLRINHFAVALGLLFGGLACYAYYPEWFSAISHALSNWGMPKSFDILTYIAMLGMLITTLSKVLQCFEVTPANTAALALSDHEALKESLKKSSILFIITALICVAKPDASIYIAIPFLLLFLFIHKEQLKDNKKKLTTFAFFMLFLHAAGEGFIPAQGIQSELNSLALGILLFMLTAILEIVVDIPTMMAENDNDGESPTSMLLKIQTAYRNYQKNPAAAWQALYRQDESNDDKPWFSPITLLSYPCYLLVNLVKKILSPFFLCIFKNNEAERKKIYADMLTFLAFFSATSISFLGAMECIQYENLTLNFSSLAHAGNLLLVIFIVASGALIETALYKKALEGIFMKQGEVAAVAGTPEGVANEARDSTNVLNDPSIIEDALNLLFGGTNEDEDEEAVVGVAGAAVVAGAVVVPAREAAEAEEAKANLTTSIQ